MGSLSGLVWGGSNIVAGFPVAELGIYAMLPSNRHVPYRVRALMDFLAQGLN